MIERKWNIPNYPWSHFMTDVIDYETLDYTHDRRVQAQDDGTVLVTGGVLYSGTDRTVFQNGDWWYARGTRTTDCDVHDEGDRYNTRLRPFASVEEAVCYIYGAPSTLFEDDGGCRMYLSMNEDGTAYVDPDTGVAATLLVQHRPDQPADTAWHAFEEHAAEPYVFVGPTPEAAVDAYYGIGWPDPS